MPAAVARTPASDADGEQTAQPGAERVRGGTPAGLRARDRAERRRPGEEQEEHTAEQERGRRIGTDPGDPERDVGHRARSGIVDQLVDAERRRRSGVADA